MSGVESQKEVTLNSHTMDFSNKGSSLLSLMDTEKIEQQHPIHLRIQTHREIISEQEVEFTSPRISGSEGTMFQTMQNPCPESPWTLSPLSTPSPSLIYHCIASLHRHEGNIYAIAASKGLVFTGSNSTRIRVWKQPDCIDRGYLKASSGEVRAILTYSNMLFSSHKDNKIRIWNFTVSERFKSKKVGTLPRKTSFLMFPKSNNATKHKDSVACMAYYHSEGLLYTGSYDKTVKAWRVSDRKCVDSFLAHEDNINAILVNQDDGCLFTCSSDGSVKIWRRVYTEDSHTLTMTLKFQPSPVNTLALSSSFNHCFLYSGSSDGMINFWEKERLCYRFNHGGFLQGHRFAVLCLATVGNLIFSGSEDTTIRVWKKEEGSCYHECLTVLDGHRGPVRCLAACLEMEKVVMGFLVYSASLDQTFKVWRIKVLPDENMCLDYSSDQRESRGKVREYDMSPVLSPSWVEKKLQGSHFNY
ncbi:putative transcription factor WD40-like family [Lupinus albus]|uniref:Putative transcription factor WD40-like family n=1 Tax=Lupinus albus TaxID=3870 RepID=A0A6A4Q6B5_LUPAL|nr:putative transcription factor WD40-like family [Lupinus albus]